MPPGFLWATCTKIRRATTERFSTEEKSLPIQSIGYTKGFTDCWANIAAYIGASDETMFGEAFFEPIARIASGAKVSDAEGVDFVIESKERVLAVALKSGPNIYNASQKKRQSQEFLALRSRLYKLHKQFDPMLGHAYGRAKSEPTKDLVYRRRSGQAFWSEITGDPDFYLKLIRLMKEEPAKHKQKYSPAWDAAVNRFTAEFVKDFCFPNGCIDWEKLVRFVSEDISK